MQSPHIKKHNFHFLTQSPHFSITARREIAPPLRPGAAPASPPHPFSPPISPISLIDPISAPPLYHSGAAPPHCAARAAVFCDFPSFLPIV